MSNGSPASIPTCSQKEDRNCSLSTSASSSNSRSAAGNAERSRLVRKYGCRFVPRRDAALSLSTRPDSIRGLPLQRAAAPSPEAESDCFTLLPPSLRGEPLLLRHPASPLSIPARL